MILVSFSSAEDALYNYVEIYHTFSSQGTENPPFSFLGDTRYKNCSIICNYYYVEWHTCNISTAFNS